MTSKIKIAFCDVWHGITDIFKRFAVWTVYTFPIIFANIWILSLINYPFLCFGWKLLIMCSLCLQVKLNWKVSVLQIVVPTLLSGKVMRTKIYILNTVLTHQIVYLRQFSYSTSWQINPSFGLISLVLIT